MPLLVPGMHNNHQHNTSANISTNRSSSTTAITAATTTNAAQTLTPEQQKQADNELLHSATFASVQGCKRAIFDGADVNAKDDAGKTGMYLAAAGGCTSTYMEILQHGGDTEAHSEDGSSALHAAAVAWPNADYNVEILTWDGADVDSRDNHGRTPLHWVVMRTHDHDQTAQAILRQGADVNAIDFDGNTALDLLYNQNVAAASGGPYVDTGREPNRMEVLLKKWGGIAHHYDTEGHPLETAVENRTTANASSDPADTKEGHANTLARNSSRAEVSDVKRPFDFDDDLGSDEDSLENFGVEHFDAGEEADDNEHSDRDETWGNDD